MTSSRWLGRVGLVLAVFIVLAVGIAIGQSSRPSLHSVVITTTSQTTTLQAAVQTTSTNPLASAYTNFAAPTTVVAATSSPSPHVRTPTTGRTPPAQSTTTKGPPGWSVVMQQDGNGDATSQPFSVTGGDVRIRYDADFGSAHDRTIAWEVYGGDTVVRGNFDSNGATEFHVDPGEYRVKTTLQGDWTSKQWTVTVEDNN